MTDLIADLTLGVAKQSGQGLQQQSFVRRSLAGGPQGVLAHTSTQGAAVTAIALLIASGLDVLREPSVAHGRGHDLRHARERTGAAHTH